MIQIREIKEAEYPAFLYGPNGELIGEIKSECQLDDIRLQIAKARVKGYCIDYNGEAISINENGFLSKWPPKFFDHSLNCLSEMCNIFYSRENGNS